MRNKKRGCAYFDTPSYFQVPQKTKLSFEERIARAKTIIEKNGFMTLYDYANATHQSRSVASKDLRQIVADPTSGITTRGSHSHKVWIADV